MDYSIFSNRPPPVKAVVLFLAHAGLLPAPMPRRAPRTHFLHAFGASFWGLRQVVARQWLSLAYAISSLPYLDRCCATSPPWERSLADDVFRHLRCQLLSMRSPGPRRYFQVCSQPTYCSACKAVLDGVEDGGPGPDGIHSSSTRAQSGTRGVKTLCVCGCWIVARLSSFEAHGAL